MVEFALSEPFPFEIGEIVEQQDSDIALSKISKYLSQEVLKEIVLLRIIIFRTKQHYLIETHWEITDREKLHLR